MNKEQVKQIKRFENIIHLVDAIFLVIYVGLFIFLFSKITVPDLPPEVFTNFEYTIFGMDIDTFTLNTWMSYLAIFIIVTFPLTFINFKKTKFREFYEYSRYVSSNYFVNAIVSLLAFNPVSFVLKIIASRRILLQSEGYGFKEASKRIWAGFKNLFKKKVKVVEEEDSDLKKAIRRQTAFTFMRMFFSYLFLSIVALLIPSFHSIG